MNTHPDLPDTLVHFTGRPRRPGDAPPDFARGTPEQRLLDILHSGTLRGAKDYWSDAPVICFSEVTEDARRVMLRDGAGWGPYAPWGLMLHRQRLIAAGVRPVLYVSREERDRMRAGLARRTYNRCVVYEPDPAGGRSDWLHEREWRLCFGSGDEPVLPLTRQPVVETAVVAGAPPVVTFPPPLVAGVLVGTPGWMPPTRGRSSEEVTASFVTAIQSVQRAMQENPHWAWPAIPVTSSSIGFAYPANGLPRWYWNGRQLIPDGVIDITAQQGDITRRLGGALPGLSTTVGPLPPAPR